MATRTPNRRFISARSESVAQTPLTVPRCTPYAKLNQRSRILTRTPLPIRQHLKPKRRAKELLHQPSRSRRNETSKEPKESLSSIVAGKSWRVYRASPFYRLKLDKKSLKLYERLLNAWLLREISKGPENPTRKTSFKVVEDGPSDEFAIEIKVMSHDDKQTSPELIAVLCCGRSNEDSTGEHILFSSVSIGDHKLTSLPICLIKSTVLLRESFLQWLEGQFGCKVSPMWFSPIDLAWLVSLCSGIGEPLHSTELTYQVPKVVPGLDTICFNIVAKDAKKLWDSIHDSCDCNDFFTSDEASKFLRSLESHFYHHFKIHLDQMKLSTIGTSVAYFGQEGRLKILQKDYVCYILQQIASIAHLANI